MFCPKCGTTQSEEMKFCNLCGANLYAVRQVVDSRETEEKLDWNKTWWVTDMFLSPEERVKRKLEIERLQGITPEVKRYNEIKGGIITSCVGVGLMIFLFVITEGIIRGVDLPRVAVEILSRAWVIGVMPFFVGLGLIINGLFVSKKLLKASDKELLTRPDELKGGAEPRPLRSADTNEFIPSNFSVTEGTTKHLRTSGREQ
ncbi:MAG: zinc ribbon domain-containing protein [Acidobacteriota bacterium]|nr:zinc ribbon domain-containing protein [Acidobacteriota bacterium]